VKITEAFKAAAPALRQFKEALEAGRLCICGQCFYFDFAKDPQAMGTCRLHGDAWPFAPFTCLQFERRRKPEATPRYTRVGTV
jgi:hypothetical protein